MDRRPPAVDFQRPVARVIMQEGPVAGEFVLHVGKAAARSAGIDIVTAADAQRNAIVLRHDDAGRDDLDIKLVNLARLERLLFVMGVVGPERPRQSSVKLAV